MFYKIFDEACKICTRGFREACKICTRVFEMHVKSAHVVLRSM